MADTVSYVLELKFQLKLNLCMHNYTSTLLLQQSPRICKVLYYMYCGVDRIRVWSTFTLA